MKTNGSPLADALRSRRGRGVSVEILLGGPSEAEKSWPQGEAPREMVAKEAAMEGEPTNQEKEELKKTGLAPKSSMSSATQMAENEDEGEDTGYEDLTEGMYPEEIAKIEKQGPRSLRERAIMAAKERMGAMKQKA